MPSTKDHLPISLIDQALPPLSAPLHVVGHNKMVNVGLHRPITKPVLSPITQRHIQVPASLMQESLQPTPTISDPNPHGPNLEGTCITLSQKPSVSMRTLSPTDYHAQAVTQTLLARIQQYAQSPQYWLFPLILKDDAIKVSLMLKKRIQTFFFPTFQKTLDQLDLDDQGFLSMMQNMYATVDPSGSKDPTTQHCLTLYTKQLQLFKEHVQPL